MNNVPADIVKAMGADRVVAINVGDLSDREGVNYTMFGLAGNTLDAMMRASAKKALAAADVVVNVPLEEYGSLDWRRAAELIDEGYRAAEAMRDRLLPLAVSETEFEAWRNARQARRRTELPTPAFVDLDGIAERRCQAAECPARASCRRAAGCQRARAGHFDRDRSGSLSDGDLAPRARRRARVRLARARTRQAVRAAVHDAGRQPREHDLERLPRHGDCAISGVRHRSDPVRSSASTAPSVRIRASRSSCIVRLVRRRSSWRPMPVSAPKTFNLIEDDAVIARYSQTISRLGLSSGSISARGAIVRIGTYLGRSTAERWAIPIFPNCAGRKPAPSCVWRMDTQDSPVVPSGGWLSEVLLSHIFDRPDVVIDEQSFDIDVVADAAVRCRESLLEHRPAQSSVRPRRPRHVVRSTPLPTNQFALGTPFRLGAYGLGRAAGRSLLPCYRRVSAASRSASRLHGRTGVRRRMARKRRCVRRVGTTPTGIQRRRRRGHGHADRPGDGGRLWSFDGRWRTYLAIGRAFR